MNRNFHLAAVPIRSIEPYSIFQFFVFVFQPTIYGFGSCQHCFDNNRQLFKVKKSSEKPHCTTLLAQHQTAQTQLVTIAGENSEEWSI